jgi:hypothetical protein
MRRRTSSLIWLLLGCAITNGCDDMCGNRIAQQVTSPDGANRVVIFERDCGATTDFSTQISILPASKHLPNKPGNIFAADAHNHLEIPLDLNGAMHVQATWKSDWELEISYPSKANLFLSAPEYQGIRISYGPN